MKVGSVRDGHGSGLFAYVDVNIIGPFGHSITQSALVDTGSNGFVSLPREVVDELGLLLVGFDVVELANAGSENVRVFGGEVTFGQQSRRVPIHSIGDEPTIGTALLRDHKLSIDFAPDGDLQVYPKSDRR